MMYTINYVFFLRVKTKAKCDKAVENIQRLLASPIKVSKTENYWKNKEFFKVTGSSVLETVSVKEAFSEIMMSLSSLSDRWTVTIPKIDDEQSEFGGSAIQESTKLQELFQVSFAASRQT